MPEPDCFLRYRISAATHNFTSGKFDVLAPAATRGFTMVLFTQAVSRRNTFVGGTCALPSALLVHYLLCWRIRPLFSCLVPVSYERHYCTGGDYKGDLQSDYQASKV